MYYRKYRQNRAVLRRIETALARDPEFDITRVFRKATEMQKLKAADLQKLIGDVNRGNLSTTLIDLLTQSKIVYKNNCVASVMVFQVSSEIIAKVTVRSTSATTDHHSLAYIHKFLPGFPAPRPHDLLSLGEYNPSFMSLVPKHDDQKRKISSQVDDLLSRLRCLTSPSNTTPLGDVEGDGCKDMRRGTRVSSKPITDATQFVDFIFASSKDTSALYTGFLRQLLPTSAKCVYTHGDIRSANEASGFYPEWWESVKMANSLALIDNFDWYKYLPSHQRYPI
ncbi:hypothetical protein F4860DRAFT_506922 [Xylaria cubensis]|nr:hypothetical protein F4860DRAFT_506922 [Xylaria cubensis]